MRRLLAIIFTFNVCLALTTIRSTPATSSPTKVVGSKSNLRSYKLIAHSLSLSFNDAYLSIDNNSVIGIQENTSGATAFQFVDAAGITSTTSSFHAYPFLNVSDQLALVGPSGFLQIQDYFTYPAQPLPSYPTALQTGGWIVSPGFSTELTNGTLRYLSYEPLDGVTQSAWIAIPRGNGSWDIRWYDGSVIITQDWVGISIIVVESDVASS